MTAEVPYQITVTGVVGVTSLQQASAVFVLTMRNPCFDASFVTIETAPLNGR